MYMYIMYYSGISLMLGEKMSLLVRCSDSRGLNVYTETECLGQPNVSCLLRCLGGLNKTTIFTHIRGQVNLLKKSN